LSDAIPPNVRRALLVLKLAPKVGDVIATVGGVASIALPVMIREMVPPLAAKSAFAVAVADVVGLKRTVTSWLAPTPTRVNALPDTMLKEAEVDTVPETVPPPVFDTDKVRFAKLPRFTSPKFTVPVGLTAKSIRATALAVVAQALSLPLVSTAVTET